MRAMEIPPFPRRIEIGDLDHFVRTRLSQTVVMWPEQARSLLGYMCYPNDMEMRARLQHMLRMWEEGSPDYRPNVWSELPRIQHRWARVADVLHLASDLMARQRQARRGGPSIGKAITLAAANTKSRGTGASTFWDCWSTYKDAAHLVTAATLICAQSRVAFAHKPFGPSGLAGNQLIPFQMARLMPDLVLAVALKFEDVALTVGRRVLARPKFDPERLWRIPANINVVPFLPPVREIRAQDLVVLNERRAGNRGKPKT